MVLKSRIILAVIGFLFFIVILFKQYFKSDNYVYLHNCKIRYKKSYNGKVVDYYYDETNRGGFTIELFSNNKIEKQTISCINDVDSIIDIGDSISKKIDSFIYKIWKDDTVLIIKCCEEFENRFD